jgi:hypothetical protein
VDDGEAGADGWVEGDDVEGAAGEGREAIAVEDLGVLNAVGAEVGASKFDGALVDVYEGDLCCGREERGDDPPLSPCA